MKTHLDFTVDIPNPSDDAEATMQVSITNYTDGPVMTIVQDTKRVRFNKVEIRELLSIFNRYEQAQAILEENNVPIC